MNATTMQAELGDDSLALLTPLVSLDPASAFLFHPFILTPITHLARNPWDMPSGGVEDE